MQIFKEPLLHFVLIGGALFALFQFFDPEAREPGDTEVVVTPGRIEQLSTIFAKTWQRPPSKDELQGLIDDFVMEEIYYREAKEAGLDQDDTLIRRRLRQKLEFLTEDLTRTKPEDAELVTFLEKNADRFRKPAKLTFRHKFFKPGQEDGDMAEILKAAAESLEKGKDVPDHQTLLPRSMQNATYAQISAAFGVEFANTIGGEKVGKWSAPIPSAFGMHLVMVDARIEGAIPPFEEIRKEVLREWEHEQRRVFREGFDQALLEKYDVRIEWPAGGESEE